MNKKTIFFILFGTLMMASCGKSVDNGNPANQQQTLAVKKLKLTDDLRQTVSIDTVCSRILNEELLLNGRVGFDMEKIIHVHSMFSGKVEKVYAELGEYVKEGDILASIRSDEVADMEKELQETKHQTAVAKRNLKAVEEMATSGILSERDLLQARQEMTEAEAEARRIHKRYEIYATDSGVFYIIKAPVSGFITERTINRGMVLRPDHEDAAFTIAGLDQVWITADVYESDINKIKEQMPVRITTLAYQEKEFIGEIDRISQVLDDESKTMSARIKLENKQQLLKPGMFTAVYIQTNNEGEKLPCVHPQAVIFENGKQHVVIVTPDNELQIRQVHVKKQTNTVCYIGNGIHAGDRVIERNALLVYNALK